MLARGGQGSNGAEVVEAIGEFDNEDTDVLAGGDEQFDEVIFGGRLVGGEIAHVFAGATEFGDAVDQKGDIFTKDFFDFG